MNGDILAAAGGVGLLLFIVFCCWYGIRDNSGGGTRGPDDDQGPISKYGNY